jgi:hypothetical protein
MITLILSRMKHLFKIPQKKGKNYISYYNEKVVLELSEIKIKNFQQLNNLNKGYFIECNIPKKNNKKTIEKICELDEEAINTLYENYSEWFEDKDITHEIIDDYYNKSYIDDMPMTLILSNNIDIDIILDNNKVDQYELIEFLKNHKKHKNYNINVDIVFLGLYINKSTFINKWAIKSINIEDNTQDFSDWKRNEIEEEWLYDLYEYNETVNNKIKDLNKSLENTKILYNEILEEKNIKEWENKIEKLKSIIFKI